MRMILSLRSFLLALVVLVTSTASFAQVGISVSFGPPALPVYEQPLCPGDGYIWTPGYWAWDDDGGDYYWVPGTWILAPQVGFLWTPALLGLGTKALLFFMTAIGGRMSVSTEESFTASAILVRLRRRTLGRRPLLL